MLGIFGNYAKICKIKCPNIPYIMNQSFWTSTAQVWLDWTPTRLGSNEFLICQLQQQALRWSMGEIRWCSMWLIHHESNIPLTHLGLSYIIPTKKRGYFHRQYPIINPKWKYFGETSWSLWNITILQDWRRGSRVLFSSEAGARASWARARGLHLTGWEVTKICEVLPLLF